METRTFQAVLQWGGWRRCAPVSLSLAFHGLVLIMSYAAGTLWRETQPDVFREGMSVELVSSLPAEVLPLPAKLAPGPLRASGAPASAGRSALAPQSGAEAGEALAPAPAGDSEPGEDVYVPPTVIMPSGPPGLRSVMGQPRCAELPAHLRPKDCNADLAARVGSLDSLLPRARADLARHFGAFMTACSYRVGCEPGQPRTINGSQAAGRQAPGSAGDRGSGTPSAGGAAGLGGLHDSVGRLGFNPDHTDPGFGD